MATNSADQDGAASERPLDRRTRRTRAAIRRAFCELAAESNYEGISVAAVAERADINRKTFYHHYASLEALENEILQEEAKHTADILQAAAVNDNGQIDIAVLFSTLNREITRSIHESSAFLPHVDDATFIDRLEPYLTARIIEGNILHLNSSLGPNLEYVVSFLCSGLLAIYRRWIHSEKPLPLEELTALASAGIAGGLAAVTLRQDLHNFENPSKDFPTITEAHTNRKDLS